MMDKELEAKKTALGVEKVRIKWESMEKMVVRIESEHQEFLIKIIKECFSDPSMCPKLLRRATGVSEEICEDFLKEMIIISED